jgi:hypothetical protein
MATRFASLADQVQGMVYTYPPFASALPHAIPDFPSTAALKEGGIEKERLPKCFAEVKVGPLVITINQGNTFMVTTEGDEVEQEQESGVVFAGHSSDFFAPICIEGSEWRLATASA